VVIELVNACAVVVGECCLTGVNIGEIYRRQIIRAHPRALPKTRKRKLCNTRNFKIIGDRTDHQVFKK